MINFWDWYDRQLIAAKQYDVPKYELEWLIIHLTCLDKLDLRLRSPNVIDKINSEVLTKLDYLWQKRLSDRLPVQYLTGSLIWRDLDLKVTPDVLIPRPETELIIDMIIENCQDSIYQNGIWVDLGTGSGAIAIALAKNFPEAKIHAVDYSEAALEIAQINADINTNTSNHKIQFHHGKWFEPLAKLSLQNHLAGIVSNPPYIPSLEVLNLQPEVKNHEPLLALDGGADGLDDIRELINTAPQYLVPNGFWIIEMMAGQAETVRSLLLKNGNYTNIKVHQDYAGGDRFISAQLNSIN